MAKAFTVLVLMSCFNSVTLLYVNVSYTADDFYNWSPAEGFGSSVTYKYRGCTDNVFVLKFSAQCNYMFVMSGHEKSRSGIRLMNRYVYKGPRPSKHPCDEFVPFWVSWENGTLRGGAGWIVGHNVQLYYQTKYSTLHAQQMNFRFRYKGHIFNVEYIIDDENVAFFKRGKLAGTWNMLTLYTQSVVICTARCREQHRCAAVSFSNVIKRCVLFGTFHTDKATVTTGRVWVVTGRA